MSLLPYSGGDSQVPHRPDSDWDIFVIADGLPDHPVDRSWEFYRMLPEELRGSVGILARTPEEFEVRLAELYLEIALDARILYDRDGSAADRLAEIRRLLDQAGLYRELTPIGYLWKWSTPPWASGLSSRSADRCPRVMMPASVSRYLSTSLLAGACYPPAPTAVSI